MSGAACFNTKLVPDSKGLGNVMMPNQFMEGTTKHFEKAQKRSVYHLYLTQG